MEHNAQLLQKNTQTRWADGVTQRWLNFRFDQISALLVGLAVFAAVFSTTPTAPHAELCCSLSRICSRVLCPRVLSVANLSCHNNKCDTPFRHALVALCRFEFGSQSLSVSFRVMANNC